MKLFTCTDHDHHYPVGVASIVVAETEEQAIQLLDRELVGRGLKPHAQKAYTLAEVESPDDPFAIILMDGNY